MISSGFLTYDRDATQQTCSNVIEPNPGGSTFRDGGGGEGSTYGLGADMNCRPVIGRLPFFLVVSDCQ